MVKKLWELIRELTPKTSSDTPTSLNCDNKTITDSKDIVESFNDFFYKYLPVSDCEHDNRSTAFT